MITEDYVSFETAKLLKEKGYWNMSTIFYKENGELIHYKVPLNNKGFSSTLGVFYEVPTLQMAMKWLREVHKIIPIVLTWGDSQNPFYYWFRIDTTKEGKWEDAIYREDEKEFSTYEQACEAAIRYCLENLI